MKRTRLLVEWDETSAMDLAEAVWNAGGTVRVLAGGVLHSSALSSHRSDKEGESSSPDNETLTPG